MSPGEAPLAAALPRTRTRATDTTTTRRALLLQGSSSSSDSNSSSRSSSSLRLRLRLDLRFRVGLCLRLRLHAHLVGMRPGLCREHPLEGGRGDFLVIRRAGEQPQHRWLLAVVAVAVGGVVATKRVRVRAVRG